jgi:hypothetical protein
MRERTGTKRVFDGLQEKGAGMWFLLSGIVERALLGRELARVFAWRPWQATEKFLGSFGFLVTDCDNGGVKCESQDSCAFTVTRSATSSP